MFRLKDKKINRIFNYFGYMAIAFGVACCVYLYHLNSTQPESHPMHQQVISYFDNDSSDYYTLLRISENIQPDIIVVGGHGSHTEDGSDSRILKGAGADTPEYSLSPKAVSRAIIERSQRLNISQYSVKLLSCNTGKGAHSFAKRLSQLLPNVIVYGPNGYVITEPQGSFRIANSPISSTSNRSFRIFKNGKEVE